MGYGSHQNREKKKKKRRCEKKRKVSRLNRGQDLVEMITNRLRRLTKLNWDHCDNVKSAIQSKLNYGKTSDEIVKEMLNELLNKEK
jgi:hypothetical protein